MEHGDTARKAEKARKARKGRRQQAEPEVRDQASEVRK